MRAGRGTRERHHEFHTRSTGREPARRAHKRQRQPRHLAHATAGQQGDDLVGLVVAERRARGTAVRLQRKLIGERMPHEARRHAMPRVKLGFERQQAKNSVAGFSDAAHPSLPPRPHLRTHVLHRWHARPLETARNPQIEFRRIDADEDRRTPRCQFFDQSTPQAQQPRQMPQDLGKPHERELIARRECLAARFAHARSGNADEARTG